MDEKIINILLEEYKAKGIDLYALLDDKYFMDLSLSSKLDMIKKYASHITSGTSKSLSKKDIKGLVLNAAISGAITGGLAMEGVRKAGNYFNKPLTPVGTVAGAMLLSGVATGAISLMNTRRVLKNKANILKRLEDVTGSPTDENALKVLIGRHHQLHAPGSNASVSGPNQLSHVTDNFKSLPKVINQNVGNRAEFDAMVLNAFNNSNLKPDVDFDTAVNAGEHAGHKWNEGFANSMNSIKKNILGI